MAAEYLRFLRSLGWFATAGGIGFLVDTTILSLLMRAADLGPLAARAASFPVAVTVTWYINRRFAFAGRGLARKHVEYGGYLVVQTLGAALNFSVFALCLKVWPFLANWPVIPLAAGAALAVIFNFTVSAATLYSAQRTG